MKKIVALALCLVMVLGLMTACQKEQGMDVKTLIQKMDEAMPNITAQGMDAEMVMEIKMTTMGMTITMNMEMDMESKNKADFSASYIDMSTTMKAMGQSEKTNLEMYGTMENGELVLYVYDETEDIWAKTTQQNFGDTMGLFTNVPQNYGDLPQESFSLAKKQETINGRKCYVLAMENDGAYYQEYLGEYVQQMITQMTGTESMDEASAAEFEALMENMDFSMLSGTTVIYVDAETFLPLEMFMEIEGMGDVYNSLFSTLMEDAMEEMDEESVAFSVEVPAFTITVKNMTYNEDVEIPAVPQEAIENAIDVDAYVDDTVVIESESFVMTIGSTDIRVTLPEGFVAYTAEEDIISAMTEDMMSYVDYMVMDVTAEEMYGYILEDVQWAQEEGYYKSHSEVAELDGYQTMSLIYNDNTSGWYAWKELDGGTLVMWTEIEGETYNLAELIATVAILEN